MEGLKRILEVHELSTSWRNTFEKRMRGEEINTKERLEGKKIINRYFFYKWCISIKVKTK